MVGDFASLESSVLASGDFLGWSIAVAGDAIIAGAQGDDHGLTNTGAAYVFLEPVGGWAGVVFESAVLVPSNAAMNDRFGWASAADGDVVVIAASHADPNGTDSGGAYVFEKPPGGWAGTINESAWLLPSDGAAGDRFGFHVAISGDIVVIGSRYDDDNGDSSGSAYVFEKPGGGWSSIVYESAKLTVSNGVADDQLGSAVSISGDVIVVGAPRRDHYDIDSGAAYLFEKPPGGWAGVLNQDAVLVPSDGAILDSFGEALVVVGDHVIIGSYSDSPSGNDSGSAYWFSKPMGGWSGTLTETAFLIADDGSTSDWFGRSVAASELGVVLGAPFDGDFGFQAGSAYAAARSSSAWAGTVNVDIKLVASDLTEGDNLGRYAAILNDMIIVGSPGHECTAGTGCGTAYLFKAPWLFGDGFESGDTTMWASVAP